MQEAVLFPFLFRLRGGSFLQELCDFEKILTVKKVNADTLAGRPPQLTGGHAPHPPIMKSQKH
jgi:hypothetical protein